MYQIPLPPNPNGRRKNEKVTSNEHNLPKWQ